MAKVSEITEQVKVALFKDFKQKKYQEIDDDENSEEDLTLDEIEEK